MEGTGGVWELPTERPPRGMFFKQSLQQEGCEVERGLSIEEGACVKRARHEGQ